MALIDVVHSVEQGLVVSDGYVHTLGDDALNIGDDAVIDPGRNARINGVELLQEAAYEASRNVAEHIGREAALSAVLGNVGDGLVLTRCRVIKAYGADVVESVHRGNEAAGYLAQLHKAHRRRVGEVRAGLDIVEGVAVFCGHGRNVVCVHVAGEDHFKTRVCKLGRYLVIILNEVHLEDVGLHREMRNKAVVRHTDDAVALGLGGFYLLGRPGDKLGAHFAACLVLVFLIRGVVGAVAAGVERDKGQTLAGLCDVGKLARFLALGRSVARDHALVGVNKVVNRCEILGLGARCGNGLAVGGVEVLGVLVAHVVVSVYDVDLHAGNVLLHLLKARGELLVAFKLAVLGQVAGNEEHVGLILSDGVEQLKIDVAALG